MAMTWREAIEKVLGEVNQPMHYSEISEQILARGYYKTAGATPAATVNAQIAASIKHDGDLSPYMKVGRGTYTLRRKIPFLSATPTPLSAHSERVDAQLEAEIEAEIEEAESVIRCFGMYWQRDLVLWKNEPRMFGKQQATAKPVDFGKQKGLYILYDHHTVIYVGRAIDRTLGRRLFEHTVDRLGSRWNRFSWFGFHAVTDEGVLKEVPVRTTLASLVTTLEALLIESLEPPQNRKRGDDFSGFEYIQDVDPEIKERELQNTLRAIEQKLRGGA